MNKYLQILIGVTTAVWLIIGIGLIIGVIFLISLPSLLGIDLTKTASKYEHAPKILSVKNGVYFHCMVEKLGAEETDRILLSWGNISTASAQKIRSCN